MGKNLRDLQSKHTHRLNTKRFASIDISAKRAGRLEKLEGESQRKLMGKRASPRKSYSSKHIVIILMRWWIRPLYL